MDKKKSDTDKLHEAIQRWNDVFVAAQAEGNKVQANAAKMVLKRLNSDLKKLKN